MHVFHTASYHELLNNSDFSQGIFGDEGNKASLCLHQRGGRSSAVRLDLYGEEEVQFHKTIANRLWRNIAPLS